ncbi:MAG: MBL fold metallo-hydrolase [Bacillota bacterium]
MEVTVLASGSKGNATYLKTDHGIFLIDAGISYRQLTSRMRSRNLSPTLDGVFLTHEHSDHTKGLFQLIKQTQVPLYAFKPTYKAARKKKNTLPDDHVHIDLPAFGPLAIGALKITPVRTSHDAAHGLGFVFEEHGKRLVYMTDTGYLDERDFPLLENAEMYIFESNYDVSMLYESERPHHLKQRIDSVRGHLSNTDSAYYLSRLVGEKTSRIILAHPSEDCNTEACALTTLRDVFRSYELDLDRYDVHVATQHTPTPTFNL